MLEDKGHRNDPTIIANAQHLRQERPPAEAKLWAQLRDQQIGFKFRYQHPIYRYVVDFCCLSARLIVEVVVTVTSNRCSMIAPAPSGWNSVAGRCCASPIWKCMSRLKGW